MPPRGPPLSEHDRAELSLEAVDVVVEGSVAGLEVADDRLHALPMASGLVECEALVTRRHLARQDLAVGQAPR